MTLQPQPEPLREPLPLFLGGNQPIIAHRIWRVDVAMKPVIAQIGYVGEDTLPPLQAIEEQLVVRLGSVGKPTVWPAGERMRAQCWAENTPVSMDDPDVAAAVMEAVGGHRAPWPDGNCECGLWGFRTDVVARGALYLYGIGCNLKPTVAIGTVKLWGRVVECEHGWRSEYAYPERIHLVSSDQLAAGARFMQDANGAYLGYPLDPGPPPSRAHFNELRRIAAQLEAAYDVETDVLTRAPLMPTQHELEANSSYWRTRPAHRPMLTIPPPPLQPPDEFFEPTTGAIAVLTFALGLGILAILYAWQLVEPGTLDILRLAFTLLLLWFVLRLIGRVYK